MTVKQIILAAAIIASIFAVMLSAPAAQAAPSTYQTVASTGTIIRYTQTLTVGSSVNPAKVAVPILISGQITAGENTYANLPISIQYSKDGLTWQGISSTSPDSVGTFKTEFIFPASGVYAVRATSGNQVVSYSQIIADRVVNLNGLEDSTSIQAAIDSLPPSGGVVYVRSGLYDLQGASLVLRSNVALIGDGIDRTIIRLYPTMHYSGMSIEDAITSNSNIENLIVENFTLIQNAEPLNNHGGIILRGGDNTNIIMRDLKITDISGAGISIQNYFSNVIVENCIIERTWTGIVVQNGFNALIQGNTIKNAIGDGIYPQIQSNGVTIENNYMENIGDTAIDISCPPPGIHRNTIVRNNTIINGPIRVSNAIDIEVANNSIRNGEIDVDAGQGRPINIMVIGNHIISKDAAGIGFYGAENSSAENNIIEMTLPAINVTQTGIVAAIWGTGQIINNTILNSANYGINFDGWRLGKESNITIQKNTIQNYGNYGIYDDNEAQLSVSLQGNVITSQKSTAQFPILTMCPENQWTINP